METETDRHTQSRTDTDGQTGTHRAGQIETETDRHTQSRTDGDRDR